MGSPPTSNGFGRLATYVEVFEARTSNLVLNLPFGSSDDRTDSWHYPGFERDTANLRLISAISLPAAAAVDIALRVSVSNGIAADTFIAVRDAVLITPIEGSSGL